MSNLLGKMSITSSSEGTKGVQIKHHRAGRPFMNVERTLEERYADGSKFQSRSKGRGSICVLAFILVTVVDVTRI